MNAWKQLISDGSEGLPPSAMRVSQLAVVFPVMFVWTVLCILKREFIALPPTVVALVLGAFAGKSAQSLFENFTGIHVAVPFPNAGAPGAVPPGWTGFPQSFAPPNPQTSNSAGDPGANKSTLS